MKYKNSEEKILYFLFFFFNDTATTEIYTLSLHDALPIYEHIGSLHIPVNDFNLSKTFIPPIFTATYADDSPDYRYARKSYPKLSLTHTANGLYLGDESGV